MSAAVPTRASKIPRLSSGGQASSPAGSPTKSLRTSTTPSETTTLVQQLRDDIAQLKRKLDEEASQTRRLKREKVRDVQRARSEERQRCKDSLADQKYRLQQEKDREIETLRAQWTKNHTLEINKILREREEFSKAGKDADRERAAHTQRLREQILTEAGEEAKRSFAADRKRFTQAIEELRSTQKKLEKELSESRSAIRHSSEDLRRLTESHQKDLESLKKAARKDIIILIDELKAKDRVIIDLEKELGHQAGYAQRLAAERDSTREELNLAKLRDIWEKTDISQRSREGSFINSSSSDLRKSPKLASSSEEPSSDKTENNSTTSQTLPEKEHFRSQNKRSPRETLSSRGSSIHSWGSPLPSTGIPTPKTHARRTLPTVGHVRGKTVPLANPTQKELQKSEEARQKLDRKCRLLEDELRKLVMS